MLTSGALESEGFAVRLLSYCQRCGVSNQQYSHYQQLLTFSWCCPPCWARDLPFHDCSVMDSTVSDDSIVSVVSSETETCYPSKLGTLRIAHLNCRSLLSHKDDVFAMFIAAQLDVLALTETWFDDTVVDSEILPCGSGLSLLRMDRNRCGGGVAFMVSTMVSFIVRPDLREGNVESLWIELFLAARDPCWCVVPIAHHLKLIFMTILLQSVRGVCLVLVKNFLLLVILTLICYILLYHSLVGYKSLCLSFN